MTKRTDHYRRALDDATYIVDKLGPAEQRMMDARPGLPGAQAFDSPTVSGGTSSSPTERTALVAAEHGDKARTDIAAMDAAIREIARHAAILRRLVDTYTPHAATGKQKAATEAANDPTPECAVTRDMLDKHERSHRTSDCGGILPTPVPLCRWVYDFIRDNGRKPTLVEITRHHRMQVVRVSA